LEPKGPLTDTRADLVWLPSLLGATFLLLAIGGWRHQWVRQRQQQSLPESTQTTPVEKALQALRLPVGRFELCKGETPAASDSLGHIIREYLQAEWNVPAFTLTPAELAAHLPEEPDVQSLLDLLQKCDTVKYGPTTDQATERFLWEETLTLFEQLDTRRAS
jgi:hypothetical protein